jgi:hypothetical protein
VRSYFVLEQDIFSKLLDQVSWQRLEPLHGTHLEDVHDSEATYIPDPRARVRAAGFYC